MEASHPLPTGLSPPDPQSKPGTAAGKMLGPDFPETSCLLGLHEA